MNVPNPTTLLAGLVVMFHLFVFSKTSVKTAVVGDGRHPRALVFTKLVEQSRFEVGDEKLFFVIFQFGFFRPSFKQAHFAAILESWVARRAARRASAAILSFSVPGGPQEEQTLQRPRRHSP